MGVASAASCEPFKGTYHEMVSPLKTGYNNTIQEALKADHQFYTRESLEPYDLGSSPSLPGLFSIFTAPVKIVKNLYSLFTQKVKGAHAIKTEAWFKIGTESANFANAVLTVIKYFILFNLLMTTTALVSAGIFALGLGISVIELVKHMHKIHKDYQFQKLIKKTLVNEMHYLHVAIQKQHVKKAEIKPHAEAILERIHKKRASLEKQYGKEYVVNIEKEVRKLNAMCHVKSKASVLAIQRKSKTLIYDFLKEFCQSNLKRIGNEYLELSEAEKTKLLKKAEQNFDESETNDALDKSLSQIRMKFRKKRLWLADRVEPWLAAEFSNKYHMLQEGLESKNKEVQKEAISLSTKFIARLNHNSIVSKNMNVLGMVTYALAIAAYAVNFFFPVITPVPIALLGVATITSTATYFYKKGYAQSKSYRFDFYNCLPGFLKKIHDKLWKGSEQQAHNRLFAENLTSLLHHEKKSAQSVKGV